MYKHSLQEQLIFVKQIEELLELGTIGPLSSPWGAPIGFAKRPDRSLLFI